MRFSPEIAFPQSLSLQRAVARMALHTFSFEGKLNCVYVWFDGAKRKANDNWFENEWDDNYWFAFVRNSLCSSPALCRGSFFFGIFHPPAKHFSDAVQRFGECGVRFRIERFQFPHKLQEEFQKIESRARSLKYGKLLAARKRACDEEVLDCFQK